MDIVTYVVDSQTFINQIHELKLWVYNGSIRLLVPICGKSVVERVEQQYKASLTPKETPKETTGRKPLAKSTRKDQPPPLFDINPRTAWEFLSRANSEKGEIGVAFQSPEETFTQWKEEEQEVEIESPQAPPTSFAEALLRKLNINDGSNTNGSKGSSKPRLVARSAEPKSPWKYHKVPKIPANGVPEELQSYFSCILWRTHESENNPLSPDTYAVLSDDAAVRSAATTLEIASSDSSMLRKLLRETANPQDHRDFNGQLEQEFQVPSSGVPQSYVEPLPLKHAGAVNGEGKTEIQGSYEENREVSNYDERLGERENATEKEPGHGSTRVENPRLVDYYSGFQKPDTDLESEQVSTQKLLNQLLQADNRNSDELLEKDSTTLICENVEEQTLAVHASVEVLDGQPNVPPRPNDSIEKNTGIDEDSDEEVIVFNPRSKRASGRPKTPAEVPKSRPSTAHEQSPTRTKAIKATRSPIISNLKPQSPIFTPGKTYLPTTTAIHGKKPPSVDEMKTELSKGSNSAPRSPQHQSSQPRHQKHSPQQKNLSQDNLQRQQSEMIIQRQREAIQRQKKASTKPPLRHIQMEPTENPTVIDPDAFDRSYVVHQPTQGSSALNGKQRPGGKPRRSPKGSPKRPSRAAAEPDIDYVLKSGNPRGSMRGKGKLWVP